MVNLGEILETSYRGMIGDLCVVLQPPVGSIITSFHLCRGGNRHLFCSAGLFKSLLGSVYALFEGRLQRDSIRANKTIKGRRFQKRKDVISRFGICPFG